MYVSTQLALLVYELKHYCRSKEWRQQSQKPHSGGSLRSFQPSYGGR